MPAEGRTSLTVHDETFEELREWKRKGESWDRFLLDLLEFLKEEEPERASG